MMTNIALRRMRKERIWSLAIIGLLIVGLTAWIIVPSISASLQEGLSSYSNSIATYMFVYNTGEDGFKSRISENVTNDIISVEGVQEVYPILINFSSFIENGNMTNLPKGAIVMVESAVIGGHGGFPQSLIVISEGKLPENEAGFLTNGVASGTFSMNTTYTAIFELSSEDERPNSTDLYKDFLGREYVQFNATAVGKMPYNPILQQVYILWNSTFLRQKLGDQLYDQTFGGEGGTLFIVKAEDINQVKTIASKIASIFDNYLGYSVVYDQATVAAQLSFQSGSGILFNLIGITSLFSVVSMVFLITYLFSGRRSWEAGLLVTQGWSWRRVTKLFFYYYIVLGIISVAISTVISLIIASQIGYSFQVYGNTLTVAILISPYMLASGIVIALLVSGVVAYFALWRMKKIGLDNLLREY